MHTLPENFTPEKQRELYQEVIRLYELTDNVLAAVQKDGILNRQTQMDIVTPFITQIINSTNIISAFYVSVSRKKTPITAEIRDTLESAFRNAFYALRELVDQAELQLKEVK